MAVIIDEFKVVIDQPPPTSGAKNAPPPQTPKADLRPVDLKDLIRHEKRRSLRLWAH